jgi:hypothetical protein|tara:strand:- start:678 stop:1097 length:420 start_codon:yes stop_codon:yes gene_type:complete
MRKSPNWEIKYRKFIEKNKDTPFVWGTWDCCLFADALIKAMTGENLIPKSLHWTDEASAKESIKKYGKTMLGSITRAAKAKKGVNVIGKMYITKGDLVVFKQKTQLVGMSDGMSILAPTDDGILVIPHDAAVKGWRIDG